VGLPQATGRRRGVQGEQLEVGPVGTVRFRSGPRLNREREVEGDKEAIGVE
jgi:hypothetical protein